MIRTTIAAAALMTVALSASAAPDSRVYAGAAIGQTDYRADCEGATSCDDKVSGGKVYMGYHLTDAVPGGIQSSVEAMYYRGAAATASDMDMDVSARMHGFGAVYKASYHVGTLELAARFGGAYTKTRTDVPGFLNDRTSHFGATYGIGASLQLNDAWALTLDADRVPAKYGDEKQGANLYSAGLRLAF